MALERGGYTRFCGAYMAFILESVLGFDVRWAIVCGVCYNHFRSALDIGRVLHNVQ